MLSFIFLKAQVSQGVIYGKVSVKNGDEYCGQLRWDNDEALWDDVFDAYKYERPAENLLTASETQRTASNSSDFSFGFMELWKDESKDVSFVFRCNFGDLAGLEVLDRKVILLSLRDGSTIKLKNNDSGDLDEDIQIFDRVLGKLKVPFRDIASIRFEPTPSDFSSHMGAPIYGRVLTTQGMFEGFITWDSEECLGKDLISGRQNGVKINIEFENIAELSARQDGSLIKLRSGKTIFLNDHDDVDRGNHGILIRNLSFGKLKIEWENFISATFIDPPELPRSYREYAPPNLLRGSVETFQGAHYRGQIIYDLDEIYDIEILNGNNNGFAYYVPFGKITTVEPQNDKYAMITLKNGEQLLLGGNNDVTSGNHGLVVKMYNGAAQYVVWKDIKRIDFE